MHSDDYFDDDELDSAFLNEVDIIEASQLPPAQPRSVSFPVNVRRSPARAPTPPPISRQAPSRTTGSDDYDLTFDVDEREIARLDEFITDSYAGKAAPVAGPSRTRQTTLDGSTFEPSAPKPPKSRSFDRTASSSRKLPFGSKPKKTKQWDRSAFAKTGWLSTKGKGKEKDKSAQYGDDGVAEDEDEDEEPIEFEQFPAPFVSLGFVPTDLCSLTITKFVLPLRSYVAQYAFFFASPMAKTKFLHSQPPPIKLKPDALAARNWIFPLNRPRRDYQFNIAKHCLFENTLVALPTGLGKTFIAGVVMLNYYKWFPNGKIVFVAPTKPLVAQQIEACHQVCGIPGSDAAELTGNVAKPKRAVAWDEKRVLYMTPQTLRNDFISDLVDPMDIILLVIDEAHKGSGDYAYAQVVRYMMAKNPHFRILALTATPGNNAEAVQGIVDSLHISHIEIRDENSIDLKPYIFQKEVKIHVIKMSESILSIRKWLIRLMEPAFKKCRDGRFVFSQSEIMLSPYACQTAMGEVRKRGQSASWAYTQLALLSVTARAMGYLMECSARMCYQLLDELRKPPSKELSKSAMQMRESVKKNPNYIGLMAEFDRQRNAGYPPHPKMDMLLQLTLSHFSNASDINGGGGPDQINSDSKMMVFVQFRDCVDEIVDIFNQHQPLLRATRFIGQSADKQGKKGINQKEQLNVIQKFKTGEFNILVSTSIGEEGLDIGEIDRIICYDSQKSSIRMLQRVGRTGRKRAGFVDVLLAEEREERNWDRSQENYTDVQQTIVRGSDLELYDDVERLLPDNITPQCLSIEMPIEEYVRSPQKQKGSKASPAKGKKRKRNDDVNRNIPIGAMDGFVTASKLTAKGAPKKKARTLKPVDEMDVEDDEDDEEIVSGLRGRPRPTKRTDKGSEKPDKRRTSGKAKAKERSTRSYLIPDQLEDDSDDQEIEGGIVITPLKSVAKPASSRVRDSDDSSPASSARKHRRLLSGSSSPERPLNAISTKQSPSPTKDRSSHASLSPASTIDSAKGSRKMNWLLDLASDSDVEIIHDSASPALSANAYPVTRQPSAVGHCPPFTTARDHAMGGGFEILPSAISDLSRAPSTPSPGRRGGGHLVETGVLPDPTFPVRRGLPAARRQLAPLPSSPSGPSSPVARRLVRRVSPVQPTDAFETIGRRDRDRRANLKHNLLFDIEAVHSGDDVSEGESDVQMMESEGDRRFLEEVQETQASPSYNQTAAYRFGLMTQAPTGAGPAFANRPKRTGTFAGGRTQPGRTRWNSSPNRGSEPDEYHMGSFVVDDDEPVLLDHSSEA